MSEENQQDKTNQSSQFDTDNVPECSGAPTDDSRVRQIIQRTLDHVQTHCQFADLDTLVSLVIPKVLYDLHAFDQLHQDLLTIKRTLNSYMHHSKVLGGDIAEIYLDLHNIYTKLDNLGSLKTEARSPSFTNRLKKAESELESSKHFINTDEKSYVSATTSEVPSEAQSDNHTYPTYPSSSQPDMELLKTLTVADIEAILANRVNKPDDDDDNDGDYMKPMVPIKTNACTRAMNYK